MAEVSLYAPPVQRRFLAGGPDVLRLSVSAAVAIIGVAALVLPIAAATFDWLSVSAGAAAALATASLSSRWLGGRLGLAAGIVQLTGLGVLTSVGRGAAEMLFCAAVTLTMSAFAVGNVPGRLATADRRSTRLAFYACLGLTFVLAGAAGPVLVLAGCVLFVVTCGDSRAVRFLADPVAIGLFALLVGARLVCPVERLWPDIVLACSSGEGSALQLSFPAMLSGLAAATVPWTPLIVAALVVALRQGHAATPIWRLFGCWLIGPLALMAVGVEYCHGPYLGVFLPPLAVMGAVGWLNSTVWCRRTIQKRGHRASKGCAAPPPMR